MDRIIGDAKKPGNRFFGNPRAASVHESEIDCELRPASRLLFQIISQTAS